MWCLAAISSTSTSTLTSIRKDSNNLKWTENNFNDIKPLETVGSAIISLSVEGEVNIWQPSFLNKNVNDKKNNLISKTEQIFTLFTIQFNLRGSYISGNVKNIPNFGDFDDVDSSLLKLRGNVISDSTDDNGFQRSDYYHNNHDNNDNHDKNNEYGDSKNINNNSCNKKKNNKKQNNKGLNVEVISGALDPSCRTILISFSDGTLQQWPLLGSVLNETFLNDTIKNDVFSSSNNDVDNNIINHINSNIINNNINNYHHHDGSIYHKFQISKKPIIAACNRSLWENVQHTGAITSIRVWTQERNWNLNNSKNINFDLNNEKLNQFDDLNKLMAIVDSNLINNLNILSSNSTMVTCSKDFSLILWKFSVFSIENNQKETNRNDIINEINNNEDDTNRNNNDKYNDNGGINNSNLNYKNIGFSFFLQPIICRKFCFSSPPHEGLCFLLPLPPPSSTSLFSSYSNSYSFSTERIKGDEKEKNINNNNNNDISIMTVKQIDDRLLYQISAIVNGATVTVTRNIKKNIFSTFILDNNIPENEYKNNNEINCKDANEKKFDSYQKNEKNLKTDIPINKLMEIQNEKENIKNLPIYSHSLVVPIKNIFSATQLFSKRSLQTFGSSMDILKSWNRSVHENGLRDEGIVQGKKAPN